MKVELQTERSTDNPVETAIMAARGDYMSESLVGATFEEVMAGTDKTKEEFVEYMISRGHWGPLEHPQAFVAVEGISRVAMAQITRHRHMSFDVQSQRYVEFSDKEPVVPPTFEGENEVAIDGVWTEHLEEHWNRSVAVYERAINADIPKEDARFFLPQATPVNLSVSGNLRSWLHLLDLRHSGAAQHEAREFASKVIEELREWAPLVIETWEQKAKNSSITSP